MSAIAAQALSAQEEAIQSGKKTVHGTITDRVLRLYEAIDPSRPPRVALDRAVLFTESFKQTEGQPLVLRWAKALKNFADKAPVHKNVIDYELLPYHRFGESKYGFLGRVYELADFKSPTPESLARLQAIIDEAFGRSGTLA